MAESTTEKITIIVTHGADDPERATLPFLAANAALAMDVKAVVILQGSGVTLALKSTVEHVFAGGMAPLQELMASFAAQGGELLVCTPCIKDRRIAPEMIPGAKPVAAARVVQECLEAKATLNY